MKLVEGLKEGDLEELVLPLISIDEYESKLDDDAIVIAFFVEDKDPAEDLNRFIQKSSVNLLDTDISPAPNDDGYFLVFVELMRNEHFPEKVLDILETLTGLVGFDKWSFEVFGQEGIFPVNEDNLLKMVRLESNVDHEKEDAENAKDDDEEDVDDKDIKEFFKPSVLDNLILESYHVTLERRGYQMQFQFIDFGTPDELLENNVIFNEAISLTESAVRNTRRIQSSLGANWIIQQLGESYIVMTHDMTDKAILLKM